MRILIIEDDEEVRSFLRKGLMAEAFAVDMAEDGDTGSYLARTNEYDIIILDNSLPMKSGLQACKEIRKSGKTIPILILSVISDPRQKTEFLNAGADDYLSKPFSFKELLARLRALLRRPRNLVQTLLTVGDLKVDIIKQTVVRGRLNIYLTRKEFSLLEYLIRNKGRILSRGMIMEHVWNVDSDPFSNTIEAHILNLRKKIHGGDRRELIHNIPGRGYTIATKVVERTRARSKVLARQK